MPVIPLKYLGINRTISDFDQTSACEELINLRPTSSGLVPVKPFEVKFNNLDFAKVFEHKTVNRTNYIGLRKGPNYVSIYRINDDGTDGTLLYTIQTSNPDATMENIHFAYAGNIILFSVADRETDGGILLNKSFIWKTGESETYRYHEIEADIPQGIMTYSVSEQLKFGSANISKIDSETMPSEMTSIISSGLNELQENNPELCIGPIIIATAFKTKDGETFWTGYWRIYDPTQKVKAESPTYVDSEEDIPGYDYTDFFSKYSHGYLLNYPIDTAIQYLWNIRVAGTKVTLTFPSLSGAWDRDTSIIESIEVYASKPIPYLDETALSDGLKTKQDPGTTAIPQVVGVLPQKEYTDMNIGGQLLYHQGSILMENLNKAPQDITLRFGWNMQVVEETLETDPGMIMRYGNILSYNTRFHYYNSIAKRELGTPNFLFLGNTSTGYSADIYIRYNDGDINRLIYVQHYVLGFSASPATIVIAPSINVTEVITTVYYNSQYYVKKYRMEKSSTYNFSICVGLPYYEEHMSSLDSEISEAFNAGLQSSLITDEHSAINVTEQFNPFVFEVEHSYLAPGKILDVQQQMVSTASIPYGDYPLNVFTDRGLYALLQGSGTVLYGNFRQLSDLVLKEGSRGVPTGMGTFFISSGSLWLVAGVHSTLISEALMEGPHKFIRTSDGYKKLSMGQYETPADVYDVSNLHSQVAFDRYLEGASLSYNRFRDELYISNSEFGYTYALSLTYRQWFKIEGNIAQDVPGSNISNVFLDGGLLRIMDFSVEEDDNVLVHMQSRPFSVGYQYAHVHRIVSMVRANLNNATNKLIVALYGSDNLQDWTLVAFAARKNVKVSQIRTHPAGRSWRYYTICIGGEVYTVDTDLGPVMVDYESVVRRIG